MPSQFLLYHRQDLMVSMLLDGENLQFPDHFTNIINDDR